MVTPLTQAEIAQVTKLANEQAAAQGISPEHVLWSYATSQGISPADLDVLMGFPSGAAANWAVSNGLMPAPQGNFNPSGVQAQTQPTTTVAATPTQPAPATTAAAQNPTVAEWYRTVLKREPDAEGMAFWTDAINRNGLDAAKQGFTASAQKELVSTNKIQPLTQAEIAQVTKLANEQAAAQGISPEHALWSYATSQGISPADLDVLMGFPSGAAANWAVSNGLMPAPQGNFNPGGVPAPTQPTTTATQNPTVAEWYRTVLKREPDAEGMAFWTDAINRNGLDAAKQSFTASAQKELVSTNKIQQGGAPPPPPTWKDTFDAFNKAHIAQYGKEINRPWNEDGDSRKAKQTIDDLYMASLKDYNAKYKTDIQPDGAVLGPTAQPNTYTPDPKTGNNFLTKLATVAASVALAPITGGASLWAGPALLGVSEAVKTGDIGKGLLTGGTAYFGAGAANSLINGAAGAAGTTAGATAAETAQANSLIAQGYSPSAAWEVVNASAGSTFGAGAAGAGGMLSAIQNGWNGITSAANAAGGVTGSQLLTTGANLLGGYLNQQAASDAAKTQSDAQIRAAQIAADAAKFKPVGVKTNLGESDFGYDANGNLNRAGYTLDPRLYQQQNQLIGAAPGMLNNFTNSQQYLQPMVDAASKAAEIGSSQAALGHGSLNLANDWRPDPNFVRQQTAPLSGAAQNAMALGNQYLQTSPQQQAAKYMAEQQGLLAPGRANDMAALQAQMQAQGRGGLMVGGGVNGQGASNPQMQALLNARMQQDAQLAANATQGGMDYAKFGIDTVNSGGNMLRSVYDTQAAAYNPYNTAQQAAQNQANFGIGMSGAAGNMMRDVFSTQTAAYAPYQQAMQGAQYLEGLGQNAMDIGLNVGAKGTASNASSGMLLANGMTNAANTVGAQALQGGSMWGNMLQGGAQAFENYNKPAGTTYDPTKYRVIPL